MCTILYSLPKTMSGPLSLHEEYGERGGKRMLKKGVNFLRAFWTFIAN